MNTNDPRFELIRRCRDGEGSAEDLAQIETCLREDVDFRLAYLRYFNLDVALSAVAKAAIEPMKSITPSRQHRNVWLAWRPLAAAAAGIVLGIFFTSVVFGFSAPRVMKHLLGLANAGFEEQSAPAFSAPTHGFGSWSGGGEVVTAQGGITPMEGRRMVRFVSKAADAQGTEPLRMAVSQLVDMRSWRALLEDGKGIVDFSASFNGTSASDTVRTNYRMDVRAYSGDVSIMEKSFPEREGQEVAHGRWRTHADHEPSKWQRVSGRIIVPPETDFLLIELKVFRPAQGASALASESTHYVDDVRMSLVTPSESQALAFTSLKP